MGRMTEEGKVGVKQIGGGGREETEWRETEGAGGEIGKRGGRGVGKRKRRGRKRGLMGGRGQKRKEKGAIEKW